MQNKYPLWKNLLLIVVAIAGVVYALPNLFSEDPAIQVNSTDPQYVVDATMEAGVMAALTAAEIDYKSIQLTTDNLLIRFFSTDDQLQAYDLLKPEIGDAYTIALNLAPSIPRWLELIYAKPMKQGLDLRGGVHFLLEVDINSVLLRRLEGMQNTIAGELREAQIRYSGIEPLLDDDGLTIRFNDAASRDSAYALLRNKYPDFVFIRESRRQRYVIQMTFSLAELNTIRQYTINQTMNILRNRVNELGVGEAVVQQKGATRVSVDLPGIQDSARAKQILGGTATLEFRLVDQVNDPVAAESGLVPPQSRLYVHNRQPILLQNEVILSGDAITSAISSYDQESGTPAVNIQLGSGGLAFNRVTRANVGNPMAIVYVETKVTTDVVDGEPVYNSEKVERVISVATIQSALGNNFQITGLRDVEEARNLSLLLRAGALPAAIYPVEERTIGPSLGKENIKRGTISLAVGMLLVLILMAIYYQLFGLVANVALILNLVFLVAILSVIGATLTLPGIAGIVLTVGMAVDANVLIYERIREELRNHVSPQVAIHAGYERALSTIIDANITTLIAALILFAIGTGPVQGFAVTLSIGLLVSMLTSIVYTRAIVNWIYGRKKVNHLLIGIKVQPA